MKYGLFGINFGVCAEPETAARVAKLAEAVGFESAWTGEHIVLPDPQAPPSPAPPETPMLDPASALAFVAARTETLRLGTGIVILPQRNPLELAKELASVDVLSKGRLIFGLGAGYLKQEFDALGIPFTRKGERTDEAIDVIRTLWTADKPSFDGTFFRFSGIQAMPRPVQKPHPPIVIGGWSAGALQRAVTRGNGWYGFSFGLEQTRDALAGLKEAADKHERPSALGRLETSVTPNAPLDADTVKRFEDLGIDRLIPLFPAPSGDEMVRKIEDFAESVLAKA